LHVYFFDEQFEVLKVEDKGHLPLLHSIFLPMLYSWKPINEVREIQIAKFWKKKKKWKNKLVGEGENYYSYSAKENNKFVLNFKFLLAPPLFK